MSSNDSVARWERQWGHLIARIRPNPAATRARLLLAETNVQRAKREVAADPDAALIFAEQALINAADAVLARDGYSANSHFVRFGYPQLPSVYSKEGQLIDRIRSARNTAQYDAGGSVAPQLAADAIRVAEKALAEVRRLLP